VIAVLVMAGACSGHLLCRLSPRTHLTERVKWTWMPGTSPTYREHKPMETSLETDHFDVIIVGAGLSGIAAGYHLQQKCPRKSFAILEGRDAIGGTWDLFRYPGIRSDSDMFTLGYSFKPWTEAKAIA